MMKNIKIIKKDDYYFVLADTKRFGTEQIMFQGQSIEACKKYIKREMAKYIKVVGRLEKTTSEQKSNIKELIQCNSISLESCFL